MKIKKKKMTKKQRIVVLILMGAILILAASTAAYYISTKNNGAPKEDSGAISQEKNNGNNEVISSDNSPDNTTSSSSQTSSTPEEEKANSPQYEGEDPNESASLSGAITYSAVSGDILTIRTNIDQVVSGTCTATLSSGGRVVTKASSIMQDPSSSSCEGFDIPVSELGSGTWKVEIKAQDTTNRSVILTTTVGI